MLGTNTTIAYIRGTVQTARKLTQIPSLLLWPALFVIGLMGISVINPTLTAEVTQQLNHLIFKYFGDFYLWVGLAALIAFPLIALSPLGQIRLGGAETKPEHSWFSWIAMMFCCGMGTGFMLWGAAEPFYHYMNPPGIGVETPSQRAAAAFVYSFLHWGLEPWAIYGVTAMVIAFFGFNLKRGLSFSAFLTDDPEPGHAESYNGSDTRSWTSWIRGSADLMTIIAIIFGIAATLASGVVNLEGGLLRLTSLPEGIPMELGIIGVLAGVYLASAASGVGKGMKLLSNASVIVSLGVLGFIIWAGPSVEMLHTLASELPSYLMNLIPLSLGRGEFTDPNWVNEWTIRYWSWWIAWAPFVGLFIASISKGRTIRELAIAVMVVPALFSFIWFTAFGQTAITLQETTAFAGESFNWHHVPSLLFKLFQVLGDGTVLPWVSCFLVIGFVCTSADSASFIMACFVRRKVITGGSPVLQLTWGTLFALLTAALLIAGNASEYNALYLLQQITEITALPFAFLLIIVFGRAMVKMIQYRQTDGSTASVEKPLSQPPLKRSASGATLYQRMGQLSSELNKNPSSLPSS